MAEGTRIPIYLEVGTKRAFAISTEWPGWARAGKTPDAAIETLLEAAPRYKRTVGSAARGLRVPKDPANLQIVQRVKGDATTEFGAPSKGIRADNEPIEQAEARRLERLLRACWDAFDRAAADAVGVELRKGPRGGGRDLDKIVEHVFDADSGYLSELGTRPPKRAEGQDPGEVMDELRKEIVRAFRSRVRGEPPERTRRSGTFWSPRYFVRRSAWHAIDHVWEIEDRSAPPQRARS
jgi:hypothetical protein